MSILANAKKRFANISPDISVAFDEIQEVANAIGSYDKITLHCDLLEAPGYHYENGLVFSAFTVGLGQEIACGGRYDGIGQTFGQSRPAIGFSSDLELLSSVSQQSDENSQRCIYAPNDKDNNLQKAISTARAMGDRVIVQLGNDDDIDWHNCTHALVKENDKWVIKAL